MRRNFDRAAHTYARASALQREVCARLGERLDLVKMDPTRVLDAGSGTGLLAGVLRARYPRAAIVEIDLSLRMLRAGLEPSMWWSRVAERLSGRARLQVCADLEKLPVATASAELLCSSFALEWILAMDTVLGEFHRVLARGGLLMFTTVGPDTLNELHAAREPGAAIAALPMLVDMHDIGDALVRAGFVDPVLDREVLTLTYNDLTSLFQDLKEGGTRGVHAPRGTGLHGRGWLLSLATRYEACRREGRLPATVEVVYGHAWKAEQPRRTTDGREIIRFERAHMGRR